MPMPLKTKLSSYNNKVNCFIVVIAILRINQELLYNRD